MDQGDNPEWLRAFQARLMAMLQGREALRLGMSGAMVRPPDRAAIEQVFQGAPMYGLRMAPALYSSGQGGLPESPGVPLVPRGALAAPPVPAGMLSGYRG